MVDSQLLLSPVNEFSKRSVDFYGFKENPKYLFDKRTKLYIMRCKNAIFFKYYVYELNIGNQSLGIIKPWSKLHKKIHLIFNS